MPISALVLFFYTLYSVQAAIDRRAVVSRHNPNTTLPLSPTSVSSLGNGAFAFNVDVTGLQSLNTSVRAFDVNTLADWGWHTSFSGVDALPSYNLTDWSTTTAGGTRVVRYPTGQNASAATGQWLHNNPHRLPLAQVALAWAGAGGGTPLTEPDLVAATQTLDAWVGASSSATSLSGARVGHCAANATVRTVVHPDVDALAVAVALTSNDASAPPPLILRIAFPYTTSGAADWSPATDALHSTTLLSSSPGRFAVERTIDGDGYRVDCAFSVNWTLARGSSPHVLTISPPADSGAAAATDFVCVFAPHGVNYPVGASTPWLQRKRAQTLALQSAATLPSYTTIATAAAEAWESYWMAGAFVDLSGATGDSDAWELERRVVRSLYLLRALEAGAEPPAETGLLLAGGWAGKHHGEMRYWHQAWAAHWGRGDDILARSDAFYADYLANATAVAAAQGYGGARWPKMTASVGNRSAANVGDVPWVGLEFAPLPSAVNGGSVAGLSPLLAWESSSPVGPLLVWQQSHSINLAEAQRRGAAAAGGAPAAAAVMARLAPIVWATADFLASFAVPNASGASPVFHLLPPLLGGEEVGDALAVSDPSFELVQIGAALDLAAAWRTALGLAPVRAWDVVRGHLAPPPLDPATVAHGSPLYSTNAACACLYERGEKACPYDRRGCPSPLGSHPMTAGLVGMLNGLGGDYGVDAAIANATTAAVLSNWSWGTLTSSPSVWGWDAPLVSLSIARLGWSAESAVAALMLPFAKNLYDAGGINQGMGEGTAYFPGNGGTLLAVAAFAAGFDAGRVGDGLRASGVGAVGGGGGGVGFPRAWHAVAEGFDVPLV